MSAEERGPAGQVRSVGKAAEVLFAVGEAPGPVSLSYVAQKTQIPIATARRFLISLVECSLLSRVGRDYALGLGIFELGKRAEESFDLIAVSRPHLRRLADDLSENANLAVLDRWDVVYLACEECRRVVRAFTVPGARVPAHATGVGKALLSGLPDEDIRRLLSDRPFSRFTPKTVGSVEGLLEDLKFVREHGYALDEGEREEGVSCVAAPVRDHRGKVIGATSVSGPSERLSKLWDEARAKVPECARKISSDLGWKG